ncbi:MAG: hypothetical protein SO253_00700 [Bacilli bacterium]|nr:hypothetical protein [Bacilli bacterium]
MKNMLIISLIASLFLQANIADNSFDIIQKEELLLNKAEKNILMQVAQNFSITEEKNYFYKNNGLVVYGNYGNLQKEQINEQINQGNTVLTYDYYLEDNLGENIFDLNSAVMYSNVNGKRVDIINAQSLPFDDFKNVIHDFYIEKTFLKLSRFNADVNNELFEPLYSGSLREVKKPYGYLDVIYNVKKYRANETSSLYLVESKASFTPGKMAKDNGDSTYGNWHNYSGYFHVQSFQAVNEINQETIRKGGIPKFKDAYPENSPGMITISSSYNVGLTLGYSFTNGFSLNNISASEDKSMGLNISYGYNKAYTTSEPALSTQRSSIDSSIYQWTYTYADPRNETNHLNTGYIFEMNNKNHDLFEGDFSLKYSYKMTVSDKGLWIFEKVRSFEATKQIDFY